VSGRGGGSSVRGSALARHGETTVMCGVSAVIATPDAERPESGFLEIYVEYAPQASEEGRPGRGHAKRDETAATTRGALVNSEILGKDLKDLCVERGAFVWRISVDITVLNDDGAVADCAVTAAVAALKDCVLPSVGAATATSVDGAEDDGDGDGVGTSLNVRATPVCLTTAMYEEHLLVDPTHDEETVSACEVSVVLTEDGLIRGVYKAGGQFEATEDTLMKCIAAAKLHYADGARVIAEAFEEDEEDK